MLTSLTIRVMIIRTQQKTFRPTTLAICHPVPEVVTKLPHTTNIWTPELDSQLNSSISISSGSFLYLVYNVTFFYEVNPTVTIVCTCVLSKLLVVEFTGDSI